MLFLPKCERHSRTVSPSSCRLVVTGVMLCATAVMGRTTAMLDVAPHQDEAAFPYRRAELTVDNRTESIIRAVALRSQQGGPTLVWPVTVAPRTVQKLLVDLPAVSVRQTYHIRLLDSGAGGEADVVEALEAAICWPAEIVTADAFLDPEACGRHEFDLPAWSSELRRNVFLAALLTSLAMAGVLFISRSGARVAVLALIVAITGACLVAAVPVEDIVVERVFDGGRTLPIHAARPNESLTLVTCRRTANWSDPDPRVAPVYSSRRQMATDTMVLHRRRGASVRIRPQEVRLFRKYSRKAPTATGTTGQADHSSASPWSCGSSSASSRSAGNLKRLPATAQAST